MKKVIGVAVAVLFVAAFAFKGYAEDVKKVETVKTPDVKEKVTTTVKGGDTTIVDKTKAAGVKEKETITTSTSKPGEVKVTDVKKFKEGSTVEESVKFQKYDAQGDYIYVMKDNKLIRVKHTLNESNKKDMLKWKEGTLVKVTSTYALDKPELAKILDIQPSAIENVKTKIEQAQPLPVKK